MNKTIEEAAKKYSCDSPVTWENFCPGDIADAFKDGAEYVMSLPLTSRMTEKEKERVRKMYAEAQSWLDEKPSFDNPNEQLRICAVVIQDRLESIFGKELFEEE